MPAEPVNVTLSEPIMAHGQSVSALTLRPMKASDIRACGSPINMRTGDMNAEAATQIIARLASIPPSSVDQLGASDYMECTAALVGFMNGPPKSPAT